MSPYGPGAHRYGPMPLFVLAVLGDGRVRSIAEIRAEIRSRYGPRARADNLRGTLLLLRRRGLARISTALGPDLRTYMTAEIVFNPELDALDVDASSR